MIDNIRSEQLNSMEEECEINIEEILEAFTGMDDQDDPKSVITMALLQYNPDAAEGGRQKSIFSAIDAYISRMYAVGCFWVVEIEYGSVSSPWIRRTLDIAQEYQQYIDKENYQLCMTIEDLAGEMDYYMFCANPIICMQGISQKTKAATVITLVFDIDCVTPVELEFNPGEVEAEILRQIELEEECYGEDDESEEYITEQISEMVNEGSVLDKNYLMFDSENGSGNDRFRNSK